MEIQLQMRTPLWTGGIETGKMDRIHASGIIGGLRWWYEVIVRGLGGEVCDPTASQCLYDPNASNNGLCAVCQVFGATGWRRRFRLQIDDQTGATWNTPSDTLNVRPPDRSRGWFLPPGRMGSLTLTLHGDQKTLRQMAALFLFLEQWGNIGAKPQLGYGLFQLDPKKRTELFQLVQEPESQSQADVWKAGDNALQSKLPDLRRFGFFRFRFQPERSDWWSHIDGLERLMGRRDTAQALQALLRHKLIPVMPAFKNAWRFQHWQGPFREQKNLFGTVGGQNERIRSKVAISWAYQHQDVWEIRGWVWLPEQNDSFGQQLWKIICSTDVWCEILNVQQGALETWPDTPIFASRSSAAVQDWVTVRQ